jgi:hypothetical protein
VAGFAAICGTSRFPEGWISTLSAIRILKIDVDEF